MPSPTPSFGPEVSRRNAIRLLLTTAVLPPVVGALTPPAAAAPPEPTSPPGATSSDDALRRLDKPSLTVTPISTIEGSRHRVSFSRAQWDGGSTVVRDVEILVGGQWVPTNTEAGRFDEQWVVFTGTTPDDSTYYYDGLEPHWVTFSACQQIGTRTVELRAAEDAFDLVVRWSLDGDNPELTYQLTAGRDDHFIVGYQSGTGSDLRDIDEVLCGPLQHAKVVYNDYSPKAAWELFAPVSLAQRTVDGEPITSGVYIPADVLEFTHERHLGGDMQPWSMGLRNDDLDVVPTFYEPHVGPLTRLTAGDQRGFAVGICLLPGTLYEAYTDLAQGEYSHRSYRSNVYDCSLTDTVHNLVDLLTDGPDVDDSLEFQPSYSGWWTRGKGYADVENQDAVRTAVAAALMSAHYLTSTDEDVLFDRARGLIEYNLSRPSTGFAPSVGGQVYGADAYRLGGETFDAVTLNAVHQVLHAQTSAPRVLGIASALSGASGAYRAPFGVALAAYELTEDPSWLRQAEQVAHWYIAAQIDRPYETNRGESGFAIGYSRYWIDLVLLYELTGNEEFLRGAHREAQRFITQTEIRPVPSGQVTVPSGRLVMQQYDWEPSALPDLAGSDPEPERVPAWMVSTSGLTIEQLSSFRLGTSESTGTGGGFVFNPCWAATLLRLAHYAGDTLMADLAQNMVVGRFTNYPGYYSRQFQVAQLRPEYPTTGPPGISGLYFHHAPGQLALAVDFLISEHEVRSRGQVAYPRTYEATFVYFKYSLYGHRAGSFYGENSVWPYFPRGVIEVDNPQVNWLTGVGNDSLYVSLSNASDEQQVARINLATPLTGLSNRGRPANVEVIDADGTRRQRRAGGGRVVVQVPARGLVSVVVRGVTLTAPWHREPSVIDRTATSFHAEDTTADGDRAQGVLLARPDQQGYDAYVYIDTVAAATLTYQIGDGPAQVIADKTYPNEWTVPVADPAVEFRYSISTPTVRTDEVALHLPAYLDGVASTPTAHLESALTTTAGDDVPIEVVLTNPTAEPLTHVGIELTTPDGWAVAVGDADTEAPPSGRARAAFTATVPTDAAVGARELAATVTWDGGTSVAEPLELIVRDALVMLDLTAEPRVIAEPGDSFEMTVAVVNAGGAPVTDRLRMWGQPGWQVADASLEVTLEPGELFQHTWTVTSPASAGYGGKYQFRAKWGDSASAVGFGHIRDKGIVVHNALGAPAYVETGAWLRSSLTGWNDIRSRYSAEGAIGGTATWTPKLPEAGLYDVAVWFPSNSDTTTSAAYVITHAGGTDEVVISQRSRPNSWVTLGSYTFDAGRTGKVTLEVRNEDFHRASAARFLQVPPTPPSVSVATAPVHADAFTSAELVVQVTAADTAVRSVLEIGLPSGWTAEPAEPLVALDPGETATIAVAVTPAPDATADALYGGTIGVAGSNTQFAAEIGSAANARTAWNNESENYVETGYWHTSSLRGWDGAHSRWAQGNDSDRTATWTGVVARPGHYLVNVWYPTNAATTRAATFEVGLPDGTVETVIVDQQNRADRWRPLGFFDLDESALVRLRCSRGGQHRASGVQVSRVEVVDD